MFLAGEFSKIAQVSKRLLHYYDEIGLFKPARIDPETGYRYYTARQLPQLNRILVLKELGLTLGQITRMLQANVSDEEIHGMLLMKQSELEQTVLQDVQRLRRIQARLAQNQGDVPDVVLKAVPPQLFLSTRKLIPSPAEGQLLVQNMVNIQRLLPSQLDAKAIGSLAAVFYADSFTLTDIDIEIGFLLHKPVREPVALSDEFVLRMRELPAVATMATSVQVGDPQLIFIAFGALGRWIEANDYHIAGPYREIGFEFSETGMAREMVVEVQLPVERTGGSAESML